VHCIVPKVVGLRLLPAARLIRRRHCRLGLVTHVRAARPVGVVVSQRPRPRTVRPKGNRVAVWVSRGRR
jgi:beta-lactam-binding protein with PASTA domain